MKTYTIKPNELEAIHLAASKEQTRYYLVGVNIESYADDTNALIATDGHRCATLRAKLNEQPIESFILGTPDIKKAVAMAKMAAKEYKRQPITIDITKDSDALTICIKVESLSEDKPPVFQVLSSFTTKPVDGYFPDWRRIIPSEEENAAPVMSFNGIYMASFSNMAQLLTEQKISQLTIKSTGAVSPIRITMPYKSEFLGVLMPMRA